ncbi:hypothetical protein C1X97_30900, partial [Pseudomonas sp. FW306-2-11AA]
VLRRPDLEPGGVIGPARSAGREDRAVRADPRRDLPDEAGIPASDLRGHGREPRAPARCAAGRDAGRLERRP